ncbi:hypothetical protein [Polyangium aurulentum]|uniref:hypothetical protein n=1 Tax=Polyangium aurulentum TaxID=2567896 RepID=UPI0010ADB849|nr:hypothetical protein [Polyangium aurulentum]UQA56402.1 hypothetical protein E8A73_034560 [Polyangium aurulentum]
MSTPAHPPRPGLAKARAQNLLRRRSIDLVATEEGPLRAIIEAADVISEGLARVEGGGRVYYGSTSVLLPARSRGGTLPDADIATLARLLGSDPHLRVRALRIACREAQARAGSIGTVRAEMVISTTAAGVELVVDVVAVVLESAAGGEAR